MKATVFAQLKNYILIFVLLASFSCGKQVNNDENTQDIETKQEENDTIAVEENVPIKVNPPYQVVSTDPSGQ